MKTLHPEAIQTKFQPFLRKDPKVFQEIQDLILTGKDFELASINPKKVAKIHKLPPIPVIKAFLELTQAGVFDMAWSIHCPDCTGIVTTQQSLAGLKEHGHCKNCAADFAAGFDQSVALTFRVNPTIAELKELNDLEVFLSNIDSEPGIQINLEPGEAHKITLNLTEGTYKVLDKDNLKIVGIPVSESNENNRQIEITFQDSSPRTRGFKTTPGETTIVFKNTGNKTHELLFAKINKPDWTDAALVSTLQEFRDMFNREMLSPAENFGIKNLSVVFTDIKGSTEMYERLGDPKAFSLVKEHFKIMEEIVRRNEGGIVKTIGDAVMAVFTTPDRAMKACLEMIQEFDEFNTNNKLKDDIIVKVGIHSGPCIAVTLNERIDYFGTNINIAARIQGLSDGRNIMVSEKTFRDSAFEPQLQSKGWKVDQFATSLKGLKDTFTIFKIFKE